MRFFRLNRLRAMFGGDTGRAADMARRWTKAAVADPQLIEDVVDLAGVLAMPSEIPPDPHNPRPVDPYRLAFEAGQQDMGRKMIALMGVTYHDLSKLETQEERPDAY